MNLKSKLCLYSISLSFLVVLTSTTNYNANYANQLIDKDLSLIAIVPKGTDIPPKKDAD